MVEHVEDGKPNEPTPLDLPTFVPYACAKLGAFFAVRVEVKTQEEYVSKLDTPKKPAKGKTPSLSQRPQASGIVKEESASDTPVRLTQEDDREVPLTVVVDANDRFVEIDIDHALEVPCMLLKILALCAPFQPHLARLALRHSPLRGAVLYEIAEVVRASQLTELCLDGSPVPERNYDILLERASRLALLSLVRCELDDAACCALSAHLAHPRPAAASLRVLALGGNRIGDAGANALADALRSNRVLLYLDLSGNRVSDAGAVRLLRSLEEFPLAADEIVSKRIRLLDRLKLRREVYARCLREVEQEKSVADFGRGRPRQGKMSRIRRGNQIETRSSLDVVSARAEAMTDELLGVFSDPFAVDQTVLRDDRLYSKGNLTLCCLNLSYNNLEYASVVELLRVLRYQSSTMSKCGSGLVRVLLEGNELPVACEEYDLINEIFDKVYRDREVSLKNAMKKLERAKSKIKN